MNPSCAAAASKSAASALPPKLASNVRAATHSFVI
jgi:hypothetical protein